MLRIISLDTESTTGKTYMTTTSYLTVEITYDKYKSKAVVPITNLSREELITELKRLHDDKVDLMKDWYKIEQEINLGG